MLTESQVTELQHWLLRRQKIEDQLTIAIASQNDHAVNFLTRDLAAFEKTKPAWAENL